MASGTVIDITIVNMSVLILKNVPSEGPGTIEDFLREKGMQYRIVDCQRESIPQSQDVDILVMLGGPMSVNEEDIYPFLTAEIELARSCISKGKKVFGICLGAQIMARALDARVYRGPGPEVGWHDIELTEDGIKDPLVKKLAVHPRAGDFWKRFRVFHWHGETFDVPTGAVRLARSEMYPNQAFRYGANAYAFQFHIEVKKDMIYEWLNDQTQDLGQLRRETETVYEDYLGRAVNFYKAFFS